MTNEEKETRALDGVNAGVANIDILKGTDIGVLRNKGTYNKSTYTKVTKPDGTVVEKVKMNQGNVNKGILDFGTNGINIGDNAVDVGVSKDISEDVVSFVDSIWGSRQAAAKTQAVRAEEAKLEQFKAERELQMGEDSLKRNTPQTLEEENEQEMTRGR